MLNDKVLLLGVAGGSCSGKSYFCLKLQERLSSLNCVILSMDSYYKDLSYLPFYQRKTRNFDHPNALDRDLFIKHLRLLSEGESIGVPIYDFLTHTRTDSVNEINCNGKVVLIEGLFALYWLEVRQFLDVNIFIDLNSTQCLNRRIERDVLKRGRTNECIVKQYDETVHPMYEKYIDFTKKYADYRLNGESPVEDLVDEIYHKIEHDVFSSDNFCIHRNGNQSCQ